MDRSEALDARREAILERWFQAVLATYPPDAAGFIAGQRDRFHNPVGATIREGLAAIFAAVRDGRPDGDLAAALDGIIRVRAVQELAPSAAVGFVYDLRGILRDALADSGLPAAELASVDAVVDRLALAAFDVYMECRQRLFDIRAREIRERTLIAARAAG